MRGTTKPPLVVKITDAVQTGHGTLMAGIYEIVNGELPAALRNVAVPITGPAPVGSRTLDAGAFLEAQEAARARRTAPAPLPSLSRAQVLERYGWVDDDLNVTATAFGFPKPTTAFSTGMFSVTRTLSWRVSDLEKWEASLGALGFTRATKTR